MTDNIGELSIKEKQRIRARRHFIDSTLKCLFPLIIATFATTLFSLFVTGRFAEAFTSASAITTTGRFISNLLLWIVLYCGVYFLSIKRKTVVRDFIIAAILGTLTFIACCFSAVKLNYYSMPLVLITVVMLVLTDKRAALMTTAVTGVMLATAFLFNAEMADVSLAEAETSVICALAVSVIVCFFVDNHYSRLKFLLVALASSLFGIPFVLATTVACGDLTINLLWNSLYSYGASVAAIFVFMPVVALLEGAFNIADDFRLNELCNMNNPLLKRLASEAPGTFNHSLVVGNLAESCASAIGENPNLARCAAYYHDIGKLKAPVYFSENQSDYNPHDELIPEVSVSMITSHTMFGEILAKQYRLPPEVVAVCREHHGTAPVGYFYRKALTLKEEGELAVDNYTYSGPKPQSKISAVVMISDTIEAALRAYTPDTKKEFEERIGKLINEKLSLGQFDECPITMGDLATIKQTIIEVLPSIHHSRVSYEKKKNA